MRTLFLITARGGSKGLPGKNIKILNGKPLIEYSIDIARELASEDDICLSTDSSEIIQLAERCGLKVPFVRPNELATDTAGHHEVILHALDFYGRKGKSYDNILLLQPTSPFRKKSHIREIISLYESEVDMVVSVKRSKANPYVNMYKENEDGYLEPFGKSEKHFTRRQDAPVTWMFNGSVYLINTKSIRKKPLHYFSNIRKYEMSEVYSIDIDTAFDFELCEIYLQHGLVDPEN